MVIVDYLRATRIRLNEAESRLSPLASPDHQPTKGTNSSTADHFEDHHQSQYLVHGGMQLSRLLSEASPLPSAPPRVEDHFFAALCLDPPPRHQQQHAPDSNSPRHSPPSSQHGLPPSPNSYARPVSTSRIFNAIRKPPQLPPRPPRISRSSAPSLRPPPVRTAQLSAPNTHSPKQPRRSRLSALSPRSETSSPSKSPRSARRQPLRNFRPPPQHLFSSLPTRRQSSPLQPREVRKPGSDSTEDTVPETLTDSQNDLERLKLDNERLRLEIEDAKQRCRVAEQTAKSLREALASTAPDWHHSLARLKGEQVRSEQLRHSYSQMIQRLTRDLERERSLRQENVHQLQQRLQQALRHLRQLELANSPSSKVSRYLSG
eukprot:c18548_g1_i3.p1 GENE.c18548_g1_i3~~c18548_g1_i3.p1  ORF type:complete len:375 (-),score=20.42 c18548_g1_i3:117-1241(-)